MKILLGTRIRIIPDNSDEVITKTGIILPESVKTVNSDKKFGIVNMKGTGTPWNRMEDIHLKQRVMYSKGDGLEYEENGAKYLILDYNQIIGV
ncbi:MAG: hypothetical protein WCO84_09440 [bacterium]